VPFHFRTIRCILISISVVSLKLLCSSERLWSNQEGVNSGFVWASPCCGPWIGRRSALHAANCHWSSGSDDDVVACGGIDISGRNDWYNDCGGGDIWLPCNMLLLIIPALALDVWRDDRSDTKPGLGVADC
jgi:hypothetical protein